MVLIQDNARQTMCFVIGGRIITGCAVLVLACQLAGAAIDVAAYDMGTPTLSDIWVNPVSGSDDNSGASQAEALRTLGAAWRSVPSSTAAGAGYCIQLMPGTYAYDEGIQNNYSERAGTHASPVVIKAASGPGTVLIEGGLNIGNCQYLYLIDLSLAAGGAHAAWGNDVLHLENCTNVLLRGLTVAGPDPVQNPDNTDIQEVIKANQCQRLYVEDCDISGTYQTAVDYFSVQYGHVTGCRVHGSGEWCMYFKGGSAYLVVHANEFFNAGLGFQAGEGSNLEVMRSPWLHYECYDVKFINNTVHHVRGTSLSAAGAYNFLAAYNTFYVVGTNSGSPDYPLFQFVHGQRGLQDTTENGSGNAETIAQALLNEGAWGSATLGDGRDMIPNKNVFVVNNIFYNPSPNRTPLSHFWVNAALTPPTDSRNIPSPAMCDDNVNIRGNVVWNGPADLSFGIDHSTTLTEAQLRADNSINVFEPQLQNPALTNFLPVAAGNLFSAAVYDAPAFSWSDAPATPAVPAGTLDNVADRDFNGTVRAAGSPPGAFASATSTNNPTPPQPTTPSPVIMANGVTNHITIHSADSLVVTATLNPANYSGYNADWWVLASTPGGWYYYDYMHGLGWQPDIAVTCQSALFSLGRTELLNMAGLPAGNYILYFGVDLTMDGQVSYDQLYYSSVTVTVE